MAPLPKRKHSTGRKGRRMAQRKRKLPNTIICKNCGAHKVPHVLCKKCGK